MASKQLFLRGLTTPVMASGTATETVFAKRYIAPNSAAQLIISPTVAASATEVGFGDTDPVGSDLVGITGAQNYQVKIPVTTGSSSAVLAVAVARHNSAGVQQSISAFTAEQTLNPTGVKTFDITGANLGSFLATDLIRVHYRFRNTNTMTAQTIGVGLNTADAAVVIPSNDVTAPSVPGNVQATSVEDPVVTWDASTDDTAVTQYRIERSTTSGSGFAQIGTTGGGTTTYTDTTAAESTTYFYRVRAADAVPNVSGPSSEATATTPNPPVNLTRTAESNTTTTTSTSARVSAKTRGAESNASTFTSTSSQQFTGAGGETRTASSNTGTTQGSSTREVDRVRTVESRAGPLEGSVSRVGAIVRTAGSNGGVIGGASSRRLTSQRSASSNGATATSTSARTLTQIVFRTASSNAGILTSTSSKSELDVTELFRTASSNAGTVQGASSRDADLKRAPSSSGTSGGSAAREIDSVRGASSSVTSGGSSSKQETDVSTLTRTANTHAAAFTSTASKVQGIPPQAPFLGMSDATFMQMYSSPYYHRARLKAKLDQELLGTGYSPIRAPTTLGGMVALERTRRGLTYPGSWRDAGLL